MCIAIACKPVCDVMHFEGNFIFLIKPFFLQDQNVVTKSETFWERNQLLRQDKKHFSSFLKGFQSSKYHKVFGRWESDFKVIVNFFDVAGFFSSSLVTSPSFMSISLLVLGLWQFLFIRDLTRNRGIWNTLSEFCQSYGDWAELGIPNLARMSL